MNLPMMVNTINSPSKHSTYRFADLFIVNGFLVVSKGGQGRALLSGAGVVEALVVAVEVALDAALRRVVLVHVLAVAVVAAEAVHLGEGGADHQQQDEKEREDAHATVNGIVSYRSLGSLGM
ncbi:hypothetical protein TYRP_005817 [Tyrophagus putrescentiae]|nr:hypothetical protein TYRP_005817 [Tyrophagus putrescentiae]